VACDDDAETRILFHRVANANYLNNHYTLISIIQSGKQTLIFGLRHISTHLERAATVNIKSKSWQLLYSTALISKYQTRNKRSRVFNFERLTFMTKKFAYVDDFSSFVIKGLDGPSLFSGGLIQFIFSCRNKCVIK
jgi:hypothetical protein